MKCKWNRVLLVAVAGVVVAAEDSAAQRVVGFREPLEGVYFAVRGIVPKGTDIASIRFYSNDATVFPEVVLATDSGKKHVPQPGALLRSVANVSGQPGYVEVSFPAYEATETQYMWALVRFPDNKTLVAAGLGGGAGMGLRADPGGFLRPKSFYAASNGVGAYVLSNFDISILASGGSPGKPDAPVTALPDGFTVQAHASRSGPGTRFVLSLPRAENTTVDLYDVAGRRVRRLADQVLPAGTHEFVWRGLDFHGVHVASGIYLYKVRVGDEIERSGKIVLLR